MRKNVFKLLLLFFLVLGFTVDSVAEPPEGFDRPPTKEQKEKVRKRIETLRMWKLTRILDLDEETAARLFPLLNRYNKKRAGIEQNLRGDMIALRDALKNKREGRLRDLLERLEKNHKALQRLKDEERTELKKILTLEQQAKFIIFQQEFDREIRKIIAEARKRRAGRFRRDKPEKGFPPER